VVLVISHLVLDLITHSKDIAVAPFIKGPKFGLGLYAKYPIVASFWRLGMVLCAGGFIKVVGLCSP
jgi:hypothetical protein